MCPSDKSDETLPAGNPPKPLAAGPKDLPVVQLAERYLAEGVFSGKAVKVFEEAVALSPDFPDFQNALSICRLVQGVTEAVRKSVGKAAPGPLTKEQWVRVDALVADFPVSADLAKCLGDVRLLEGDWNGASQAYQSAHAKGYRDNQAIVNSGRLALTCPDCPASVLAYFGEMALSLGQFAQAVEFYTEALRRSKGDYDAAVATLNFVSERLLPLLDPSVEKQSLLTEVVRLSVDLNLMDRALAVFGQMELKGFAHGELVKRIARYLIEQEDFRQAFDYLSRIPFDSETKSLVNEIAVKMEQQGEIDTAVHLLRYINEHDLVIREAEQFVEDRLESEAKRQLAERCFRSGRFEAALAHYLVLVRKNLPEVGEFADRLEAIVTQIAQPKAEDLFCIGECFHKRRDWRRAEFFLNRALQVDPQNGLVRQLLRPVYDAILKADPNAGQIRLRSGDLYLASDHIEDAIEEYKKALESPTDYVDAHRRLALAYRCAGEPLLAFKQYRDLPLQASDLDILFDLHERLINAGLFPEALEAATLIHEFDNQYRDVGERIAQLEQTIHPTEGAQPFRDSKMIELIGDQAIGRYRYIEQVGSGGMGVVHKVYDLKNKCVVAMKILRESLTGSSKALDRFFREARIAATFNHPNIVNIFDYNINSIQGKSYISMEYVDGPSLRGIIEERFSVSGELTSEYIAEILYYILQLCDALETTHMKGIIHRDIKPDNVMITAARVVKITDFGIVHIEDATFTPTGALIGTPRYMSPEQVKGGRVDCRSDIYAVGIIMYESLLGVPPFVTGDIAYQHVSCPPTSPREVNPSIPQEVEAVILCCLEKDPRRRYQRTRELGQAVQDVLEKLYPRILARFRNEHLSSTVEVSSLRRNVARANA